MILKHKVINLPFIAPENWNLTIRSDVNELVVKACIKPQWADSIGRDDKGLFVGSSKSGGKFYWLNPGEYTTKVKKFF